MDSKYVENVLNRILGIRIPYLLINLLLCHGFLNNIKSIVILNFPKSMLKYYFSKVFGILECNSNNFKKIPNISKQRIHAEETHNPDYVMNFITTTPFISDNLKRLLFNSSLNYSYIQTKYNDK